MSTEKHLIKWLRRPEKTFCESLIFAIKAWKSAEFTFSRKYEIIINWVAEEGAKQNELPLKELFEILELRAQPTSISLEIKEKFIHMLLAHGENCTLNFEFSELFCKLLAVEWMQDLLRNNHILMGSIYGRLLECYKEHLSIDNDSKESIVNKQKAELFSRILTLLKDHMQNASNTELIRSYDEFILQHLLDVQILLRFKFNIDYFEELREIEQSIRVFTEETFEEALKKLPIQNALVLMEIIIVNQRLQQNLQAGIIRTVFPVFENNVDAVNILKRAAYVLNILRKHDVLLNFKIDEKSVLAFLGERIMEYARHFKESNLDDLLLVLCAALRLNPMILEKQIFELTTWIIVATKNNANAAKTHELFEEYLVLLLEMFRKLSRAEKFVVNLLKTLNNWLKDHEMQPITNTKGKRKLEETTTTPTTKRKKIDCETTFEDSKSTAKVKVTLISFLEMLFKDFNKENRATKCVNVPKIISNSFPHLQSAWPSSTVGLAFSRLITGLVTKASIAIWKTLLYALKDQLETLAKSEMDLNTENTSFCLDIHSALLCQYFAGAKLTEQYEKHATEIKQQREFTHDILATFGQLILNRSYHKRTVNAFLECCYSVANFELLLAYYKPDGFEDNSLTAMELVTHLHAYLSVQEWTDLHEKILNYGKKNCLTLYERLQLQRAEAQKLLQETSEDKQTRFTKILGCKNNVVALDKFLSSSPHPDWLIKQLNRKEKIELIKIKLENVPSSKLNDFLQHVQTNAEALEILAYALFERLQMEFKTSAKSSLLASLVCDFDFVRHCSPNDHQDFDRIIKSLVADIGKNLTMCRIKNLPATAVADIISILQQLPLGYLRRQAKSLLFTFYLAFYHDLKGAEADEEARQVFDCFADFLHFGQQVPIFRFFEMKIILEILPISECWEFYKFIFSTIKNEDKGTEEFLLSLERMLCDALQTTETLSSDQRRLLLIAIESLADLNGVVARRMFKHNQALLTIYGNYIFNHLKVENSTKKSKKFVEKTLSGFAPFAKVVLNAAVNNRIQENKEEKLPVKDNKDVQKTLKPLDEDFRRICKTYIGHSLNYRNPHAINLMQVALNNRKSLHLDQDEIELVLTDYWRQLNADMQHNRLYDMNNDANSSLQDDEVLTPANITKNVEALMRIIIENKTNEDFLLTLKDIGTNIKEEKNYKNILETLTLIGKSKFSTIKGAIFNEQFKQITSNIILRLTKSQKQTQFDDHGVVSSMLNLQQICVDNKTIPITPDTLDIIIAFLVEINIKKFVLTNTNAKDFFALHANMTSLCTSLVKQRHILLMDRVPQFMHVFKDLLQAIIHYKSEREKDTALDPNELNELAELALKLEVLMHNIANHSTDVKRVAPFVLIFTINLMVTCKRPTTLYSKIKTHIEAICYSLIGVCDHRVGHFILRCSNEAARQTYELLVKDYKKYHKFKGKV